MPRYKLIIEYNGSGYAGWQSQPDRPSIQASLERAVEQFCGVAAEVVGAGRTDAGVHATAQAAHVDLPKEYDPYNVMQGINFHLATQGHHPIAVIHAQEVPSDFHARFSALRRHYRYRIINRRARLGLDMGHAWHVAEPLSEEAMREAARHLLGNHDFTSFRDTDCQAKSPIKTLDRLDITRRGDELLVETDARSFLHHQVRIMVGTLVMVGKGAWNAEKVMAALHAKNRAAAGPTAPPEGLYLVRVDYPSLI